MSQRWLGLWLADTHFHLLRRFTAARIDPKPINKQCEGQPSREKRRAISA